MLTTILVPTDGSDQANRAVALAADLAVKYGARVVLLHVLLQGEPAVDFGHMAEVEHMLEPEGAGAPASALGRLASGLGGDGTPPAHLLEKLAGQILDAAERVLRRKGVREVTTKTASGDPAKQILDCAEAEGVDLIVTGSRGLGTLKGLLLGSVSQKVSHLASCNCMIVR